MKKRILSLFVGLLLIPASVVGTIYWLDQGGFFNLEHIEISVLNPIETVRNQNLYLKPLVSDLEKKLDALRGKSLWDLDLSQISSLLGDLKWVETNYVSRSWPARLNIRVIPKDVKLLYVAKSGQMFPIVDEGKFLDAVSAKQIPDVALLEGEIFEKNREMRVKAIKVISEIPAEGKFSKKNISELRFDPKEGFWATLVQSGIRVKIGQDQVPIKSLRISQVIEYLESRQLEARVIDGNLSKKVLVRLRKDP